MLRGNEITVSLVPIMMLHRKVLGRYELRVEHTVTCPVLLVTDIYRLKDNIRKFLVIIVRTHLDSKELGSVGKSVHAYRQVLLLFRYPLTQLLYMLHFHMLP